MLRKCVGKVYGVKGVFCVGYTLFFDGVLHGFRLRHREMASRTPREVNAGLLGMAYRHKNAGCAGRKTGNAHKIVEINGKIGNTSARRPGTLTVRPGSTHAVNL